MPMTLRDSLIARLDVSPAVKAVAQIAACIGREIEESVLRQSAALAADVLDEGLERLTDSGLAVAEAGGRYRFRHALLCDIAYETLLTPRRQSLHARIAETLETMPGDRALAEPEVLARHWFGLESTNAPRPTGYGRAIAPRTGKTNSMRLQSFSRRMSLIPPKPLRSMYREHFIRRRMRPLSF